MPPNLSKVLFHWGLEKEVKRFGLRSEGIDLCLCGSLLFVLIQKQSYPVSL